MEIQYSWKRCMEYRNRYNGCFIMYHHFKANADGFTAEITGVCLSCNNQTNTATGKYGKPELQMNRDNREIKVKIDSINASINHDCFDAKNGGVMCQN